MPVQRALQVVGTLVDGLVERDVVDLLALHLGRQRAERLGERHLFVVGEVDLVLAGLPGDLALFELQVSTRVCGNLDHVGPTAAGATDGGHLRGFDFATSCSLEVGHSSGRGVIVSTGLKNSMADYHANNYYPQAVDHAAMRYGAFIQLWSTRHGRGRVLAFTDSTIFSNFCTFEPGATFPLHRHAQEQVTLVEEGEVRLTVADATETLTAGAWSVTPGDVEHGITAGPAGARIVAVLSPRRTGTADITVTATPED